MNGTPLRSLVCLGILVLMCSLAFIAEPCSATEVWSDNFDDGVLDGWSINGPATITDGCLRGTGPFTVRRPCNMTVGTWSFDARDIGGWQYTWPHLWVSFVQTQEHNYRLKIVLQRSDPGKQYHYSLWMFNTVLDDYYGLQGSADELMGTLHHVSFTRNAAGDMSVYLNGSRILSGTDTQITSSEEFSIASLGDWAIDNIVVDDEPLGIPIELLAVGAGAMAIVVVAVLILKRRG